MTSYLLAGPAEEPVSLARAKAWLRVEDDAEDGLIESLVMAARIHLERVTGRALMTQSWRVVLDGWPGEGVVTLPVSPLIALSGIRAYDAAGDATELALGQFSVDAHRTPAAVFVPGTVAGMPVLRERRGIEIDYVAGFGTEPEDVPNDLVQAVKTLVGYWYENRDGVILGAESHFVPAGFERLVSPYKRVRL